jgi:predicted patatin/cPLA2 family phospholipase
MRSRMFAPISCLLLAATVVATGCQASSRNKAKYPTVAGSGIYSRDVYDLPAQAEANSLGTAETYAVIAAEARAKLKAAAPPGVPERHILCLSGGGSLGAYPAGVIYGWTCRGDRPTFDVVCGISTGALCSPFAFLGPKYDQKMKEFFTTLTNDDVYKKHIVKGLLGADAFTDNAPLGRIVDGVLTDEFIADLGAAHASGRRLYVGTTTEEGRRAVVWDVGEIAMRDGPCSRPLIRQILLASASIPGFFPPQNIDVTIDGKWYTEKHVDGGVSQSIFLRPPYVPPELRNDKAQMNLTKTKVYAIVAGKLFSDPVASDSKALSLAGESISTMMYAMTRGDLLRMYLGTLLAGADMYFSGIPTGFETYLSPVDFIPAETTKLFNEGVRVSMDGTAWRTAPPYALESEGEVIKYRNGRNLTFEQHGPVIPIAGPNKKFIPAYGASGIPNVPPTK